jgi:hypothetical protein
MKLNELTKSLNIWTSNEEQQLLNSINEPLPLAAFSEREKTIIESLVRKSLLIIVNGQESTYIYPNI